MYRLLGQCVRPVCFRLDLLQLCVFVLQLLFQPAVFKGGLLQLFRVVFNLLLEAWNSVGLHLLLGDRVSLLGYLGLELCLIRLFLLELFC